MAPIKTCIQSTREIFSAQKMEITRDKEYWDNRGRHIFGSTSFENWEVDISRLLSNLEKLQ
jgi:hypothetical protein